MSAVFVRAALEVAVNAMTPPLITAWENVAFLSPGTTVPYQQVFVLFGKPDNVEWGRGYREIGYMQITLKYPLQQGPAPAATRAELIRTAFKKGTSLTQSGIVVTINETPAIGNGVIDGDRWALPVKIPFHANLFS